jgi:hypothetical protein
MSSYLLDAHEVSNVLFWPRPVPLPNPFIVPCGDADLACHYHECDRNAATVVFFHGNGEVVADYATILPRVFEIIGCNTFLAEYRGYGKSTGSPSLGRLFSDCRHVLARIPAPPERLIFFGRSLGCLPAVEAVSLAPNALGLVLESGIADVYEAVLCHLARQYGPPGNYTTFPFDAMQLEDLRGQARAHCDIQTKLAGFKGYGLVTYAQQDLARREGDAKLLCSWLPGPKRLRGFTNANHNTALVANLKTYCEQIREMVNRTYSSD